MIFLLLKVSGLDHTPEQILHQWALEPSQVWLAGEVSATGRPHADCGFNVTLADHDHWADALPELIDFIDAKGDLFAELSGLGAHVALNVGVSVGARESFAAPLEFPRAFLAELASRDINLSVIAFPAAEES